MATPPAQSAVHAGIESPHRKPRGIGGVAPGDISEESSSTTLGQLATDHRIARLTRQFTGKADYDPFQATEWTGVVTAQLRMTNLWEIYEDVQSYSGTHLALIQDIIDKEGGDTKLKSYQVPVVCVRVPELEKALPPVRRNSCGEIDLDYRNPEAILQRTYIGLAGLKNRQSMQLPPVGSTVKVSCDNNFFYSQEGKYNGYITEITTLNQVRTLQIHTDCPVDSAKGKFDGKKEPQGLPGTEEKSAKAEPEKEGWFSKNQPKGKDGQRALNRGGVVDFAKNFWDSASESFGGGEDSSGEALIGQERTQSLRSQKPSNQ